MLYKQNIILYPSYRTGKIYAIGRLVKANEDIAFMSNLYDEIKAKYPRIKLSLRTVLSLSKELDSIAEIDYYYNDVLFLKSISEFKDKIEEDSSLDATDIGKIILSKKQYSQLYLNNIIYLIYKKYLLKKNKAAFKANFEAWEHGPVEVNLRPKISKYKDKLLPELTSREKSALILRLEQLEFDDYLCKVIDDVMEDYPKNSDSRLYKECHKKNGAWYQVYINKISSDNKITDDLILQYE